MQHSGGSNSREDKVRRFLARVPEEAERVRAETLDGDTWEAVHVLALPIEDEATAARDAIRAIQDVADTVGKRVRGRVACYLEGDDAPLVLRTMHDPDPDATPTDVSEMDGSRESLVTQSQRHLEGLWRIGLQERHHMRTGFQEVLEQQGRVIDKLCDLVELSHRRESEARDLANGLWESAMEAQADGEDGEAPALPSPAEQLGQAMQLLGTLNQLRRGAKPPARRKAGDTDNDNNSDAQASASEGEA